MRKVFIVALVLDVIYQLIFYRWVYPGQALIVATVLAIIPYLLIRGPVTRIARRFIQATRTQMARLKKAGRNSTPRASSLTIAPG